MIGRGIRMALALSALVPAVSAAQGHPRPGADVVNELRRHHHAGDWWRITTDDARYEARVVEIDAEGLASVTVARRAPPAPERIAWSAFVRIDLRKSHATRGAIQGMLLGMGAGFIPLANGNANSKQPGTYMLGGALAGYLVGGMLGGADVHERPLYVAPAPPAAPATPIVASRATSRAETGAFVQPGDSAIAAARDSAATDTATGAKPAIALPGSTPPGDRPAVASAPATAAKGAASPEITLACRRLSTHSLLRIDGGFGTFYGYASSIGPEGLGGLRVEMTRRSVPSPGALSWDRIDRVEVRGNNAGTGALHGALGLGAFTGLLGIPIGQVLTSNGNDGGAGRAGIVLECTAVGAGLGLVLGTAIGATTSGWHRVYQRR